MIPFGVRNFSENVAFVFSEDDSIEELAAQFPTGRTSSTPVKVHVVVFEL